MVELLGFLAFILAPVAFFMSLGARSQIQELERERQARDLKLDDLLERVARIERQVRNLGPRPEATMGPSQEAEPAPPAAELPQPPALPDDVPSLEPAAAPDATIPEPLTSSEAEAVPTQPDAAPEGAMPAVAADATITGPLPSTEPDAVPTQPDAPAAAATADAASPVEDDQAVPVHASAAEPPPPPVARRSLEEAIGTRWTVWVGGLALALGAILLVTYSIERGFFGPRVRVALGFVLAATLIGAGEFLRRRDRQPEADVRLAYIPGMLTATGTIAAFGTIYSAFALYHFIGPATALVALGATALACMAAAALHGPALAGLGLAGALGTPFLIPSAEPNPWAIVVYVGIVASAAHGLSRRQNWLWLSLAAAAGAGAWALLLLLGAVRMGFFTAAMAHIALQTALAALFIAAVRLGQIPDEAATLDRPGTIVLAGAAIVTILALWLGSVAGHYGWTWLAGGAVVTVILAATAGRIAPVAAAMAAAGIIVLAGLVLWPPLVMRLDGTFPMVIAGLFRPADPVRYSIAAALGCIGIATLATARLARAGDLPFIPAVAYAGAAALTPLGALAIAYLRFAEGKASLPLTLAALAAALAFAAGTWLFLNLRPANSGTPIRLGLGALASAAIAAAALALVFALEGGMLTVAFGLAAAGTAFVAVRLDITALRWCVAALGILVAARLAWDPRIVGANLSPTPIFNWLLFGYGVPAIGFAVAARVMRSRGDDTPVRVSDALAVLFAAFLVFFEIRHAMNGGDPFARGSGLFEQGLLAVSSFGFGIVLTRLDAGRANVVFRVASLAAGAIGMILAVIGLGVRWNPLLWDQPVEGGRVLNALMLGYLLPGLLAGLLAVFAYRSRPNWYWGGAGAISLALCLAFLILEARLLFHGQAISLDRGASLAELGVHTTICLLAAAAIAGVYGRIASRFFQAALIATGSLAGLIGFWGLGIAHNPLINPAPLAGGALINALIPGYLLPALAAAALARMARPLPLNYRYAAAAAAFALGLVYLLLETRVLFRGQAISLTRGASLAELGVHTTICLVIAIGLAFARTRRASWLQRYLVLPHTFPEHAFSAVAALAGVIFIAGPVIGVNPLLDPTPVTGGAIFNALIPGYLLPALAAAALAFVARPLPPIEWKSAGAAALAIALAYLVLEVRVLFHGASIAAAYGAGIAELGVDASIFLAVATALMFGARKRQSRTLALGAMTVAALAFVTVALGLGFAVNPLFTGGLVRGNALFNTLLVGYGLPALLAFVLAREASRNDEALAPPAFRVTASIVSIATLFVFVTLETRRFFQGEIVAFGLPTGESEWYAYSAVWLVLGVALLAYGLWRRATIMRLASAAFVIASVAKVFLFDLAGLEGILRAASFIGLGLCLIGIGLAYQKLVFGQRGAPETAAPNAGTA